MLFDLADRRDPVSFFENEFADGPSYEKELGDVGKYSGACPEDWDGLVRRGSF